MTTSVLVLGLGVSGASAAAYCAARPDRFGPVVACDSTDDDRVRAVAEGLQSGGVEVRLGSAEVQGSFDLCIASPGIPPQAAIMVSATAAASEVVSEIEFAYRESSNPWVAITGTNGKTTTTALVEHLLTIGGVSARAVGNIGAPAICAVVDDSGMVLVAEVSSFQLALTSRFHPRVAVLLNVTPDHLDWHGSLERYAEDKAKVFANLTADDAAVIDADDEGSRRWLEPAARSGARVCRVSRNDATAEAFVRDGVLSLRANGTDLPLIDGAKLLIRGPHNVSNALAAAAAAHAMGVHASDIARGLETFRPIEHRLEPAGIACGAEWFNDSKATNPDAVRKAIAAFSDRALVLLLGGRNKGNEFRQLAAEAASAARVVVVFGEARQEIVRAFDGTGATVVEASSLEDAVRAAAELVVPGEAVLLSPACASFDEFANYEERGRVFKQLVVRLEECGS